VRGIMRKRVEMAGDKGCDGVDPDNVDGYVSVLLLHLREQLAFMEWRRRGQFAICT
jgi:hypothetical protein